MTRLFPYPNQNGHLNTIGLAAVSATEAWALFDDGLLRWDGGIWRPQRLPTPPPAPQGVRGPFWWVALDVDAPNSIWLAGYRGKAGTGSKIFSTFFRGTCS